MPTTSNPRQPSTKPVRSYTWQPSRGIPVTVLLNYYGGLWEMWLGDLHLGDVWKRSGIGWRWCQHGYGAQGQDLSAVERGSGLTIMDLAISDLLFELRKAGKV